MNEVGEGIKQPPCDLIQPLRAGSVLAPCGNVANCNTGDARMWPNRRSQPFKPDPFHRKPSHIHKHQQPRTNAAAYTTMTTTTIRRRKLVNFVFIIMLLLLLLVD